MSTTPTSSSSVTLVEPVSVLVDSIHDFVTMTGGNSSSKNRWYACTKGQGCQRFCRKVMDPLSISIDETAVPVNRHYPEFMDPWVLRRSFGHVRVTIKEENPKPVSRHNTEE